MLRQSFWTRGSESSWALAWTTRQRINLQQLFRDLIWCIGCHWFQRKTLWSGHQNSLQHLLYYCTVFCLNWCAVISKGSGGLSCQRLLLQKANQSPHLLTGSACTIAFLLQNTLQHVHLLYIAVACTACCMLQVNMDPLNALNNFDYIPIHTVMLFEAHLTDSHFSGRSLFGLQFWAPHIHECVHVWLQNTHTHTPPQHDPLVTLLYYHKRVVAMARTLLFCYLVKSPSASSLHRFWCLRIRPSQVPKPQ